MKKILLTMICAMVSLVGMAQEETEVLEYNDDLFVTVDGNTTGPYAAKVMVLFNEDGTFNFALNNFVLIDGEDMMPVGNIVVSGMELEEAGEDLYSFHYVGNIQIAEGDDESQPFWMGPLLGDVPLDLSGVLSPDFLYVTIDITLEVAGEVQVVHVTFGRDMSETATFEDDLYVTVDGNITGPYAAKVMVSANEDGTINFSLNNFVLIDGEDQMPVGNIVVSNMEVIEEDGYMSFNFVGNIQIAEGNDSSQPFWMGPLLGDVPLDLKGKLSEDKLYVEIDITMEVSGETQVIHVTFGSDLGASNPPAPSTYALTFIVDGQTVASVELEEGDTVTYPEVVQKEGYTFAWEGETVTTMPAEALTIKGSYTINSYTINYYVNDYLVYSEEVEYGAAIDALSLELREGYTLSEWDEVPVTMPAHDVDVHATETVNSYTVTYMDGDKVIATYTVNFGEAMPEAPEFSVESDDRYTRTFLGWNGETCETMPDHDVTYTAVIDVVDAINGIAAGKNAQAYDLQGRRANDNARGLYIVGGKKVVR